MRSFSHDASFAKSKHHRSSSLILKPASLEVREECKESGEIDPAIRDLRDKQLLGRLINDTNSLATKHANKWLDESSSGDKQKSSSSSSEEGPKPNDISDLEFEERKSDQKCSEIRHETNPKME
jgi:hypothetical protein